MNLDTTPYIPVVSSNVDAIKHDGDQTMRVRYKHGGEYDFSPVSVSRFNSILHGSSVGKAIPALGIKGVKVAKE